MAWGAQGVCDGVCVCVYVRACTWHCCGDIHSERQTGRQRERPVERSLDLICFRAQPLSLNVSESVCVCARNCVRADVLYLRAQGGSCVSQRSLSGPILRPVTHRGPRPPQAHWANDQPWQLKPICESVWHQEGHLLSAL